jgi:hypothetical protein
MLFSAFFVGFGGVRQTISGGLCGVKTAAIFGSGQG